MMSLPAPVISSEARDYWKSINDRQLKLGHCRSCGKHYHYPRSHCPFCLSAETGLVQASGRGSIYSYSVIHRGPGKGSIPAFITLEEGVTILSGIVGCDPASVEIGLSVEVDFVSTDGEQLVPMFTLSDQGEKSNER